MKKTNERKDLRRELGKVKVEREREKGERE